MPRNHHIKQFVQFYKAAYEYMDSVPRAPGIQRLYQTIPIKFQALIYDIAEGEKLPDLKVFHDFSYTYGRH